MKKLYFFLIAFGFITPLFSQTISGKVFDAETKEPLAFANFTFNSNPRMSTSSDIDGRFSFINFEKITTLTCTYVGYETQSILIENNKTLEITEDIKSVLINCNEEIIKNQ